MKPKKDSNQFISQIRYDTTPPPPSTSYKVRLYPLAANRHQASQTQAFFLSELKNLYIPCDMNLPADELVICEEEYNSMAAKELHPDDEILISEDIMLE